MILSKIISGGQTGADQGGLVAGQILGIPTGGTAPRRFWTDTGSNFGLRDVFGLSEGKYDPKTYPLRTLANVRDSDGTLLVGNLDSPGSRLTIRYCQKLDKPYICNPTAASLRRWIIEENISTLNVAGNRERTNPGIHDRVVVLLIKALGLGGCQ